MVSAQQNALGEISGTICDPQTTYNHLLYRKYRSGYTTLVKFKSRGRSFGIVSSLDPIGRSFCVSPNRTVLLLWFN